MYVEFQQSVEIKKYSAEEDDQEGICFALALHWVKIALETKSDDQVARVGKVRGLVEAAIDLQRHYARLHGLAEPDSSIENPGVVKALGMIQYFGATVGVEIDRTVRDQVLMTMIRGSDNLDAIAERLRTPGAGHMLSFQYAGGKGHAMATRARSSGFWYTFSPEVMLFDPNGGELDMNKETLKTFLRNHFDDNNADSLLIVKVKKLGG